jgi:hypothetical protein
MATSRGYDVWEDWCRRTYDGMQRSGKRRRGGDGCGRCESLTGGGVLARRTCALPIREDNREGSAKMLWRRWKASGAVGPPTEVGVEGP